MGQRARRRDERRVSDVDASKYQASPSAQGIEVVDDEIVRCDQIRHGAGGGGRETVEREIRIRGFQPECDGANFIAVRVGGRKFADGSSRDGAAGLEVEVVGGRAVRDHGRGRRRATTGRYGIRRPANDGLRSSEGTACGEEAQEPDEQGFPRNDTPRGSALTARHRLHPSPAARSSHPAASVVHLKRRTLRNSDVYRFFLKILAFAGVSPAR